MVGREVLAGCGGVETSEGVGGLSYRSPIFLIHTPPLRLIDLYVLLFPLLDISNHHPPLHHNIHIDNHSIPSFSFLLSSPLPPPSSFPTFPLFPKIIPENLPIPPGSRSVKYTQGEKSQIDLSTDPLFLNTCSLPPFWIL